jgi:hypothetical protein
MLYIERDRDGAIKAIHQTPTREAVEQKTLMDEEILHFLSRDGKLDSWIQLLSLSDVSIIRVLEDLIDVLVRKNIIMLTDLPEEARDKLRQRKKVREKIDNGHLIVEDIL